MRSGLLGAGAATVYAVDGVSFSIEKGETLALVGESGCGKSTVGRCILRLFDITGGQVILDGQRIDDLSIGALRPLRRRMQVVFQDPFSSLNPRLGCATSWPSRCATSAWPNPAPISKRGSRA